MVERLRGVSAIVLGRRPARTVWWVGAAVLLFVGVTAIYSMGYYTVVYERVPGQFIVAGGVIVLVGLAALQTVHNESLLASLLLAIAPVVALFIHIVGAGQTTDPTLLDAVLRGTAFGVAFGIPIGLAGFLLGQAIRRIPKR